MRMRSARATPCLGGHGIRSRERSYGVDVLGVALLFMQSMACAPAPKQPISRVWLASDGRYLPQLRACLGELCVRPTPIADSATNLASSKHSSSVTVDFATDDICPGAPVGVPRVVDSQCRSIPLYDYDVWQSADGTVERIDARVLWDRPAIPGWELIAGELVNVAEAQTLTTDQLLLIYEWSLGASLSLAPELERKALGAFPELNSGRRRHQQQKQQQQQPGYCGQARRSAIENFLFKRDDLDRGRCRAAFEKAHPPGRLGSKPYVVENVVVKYDPDVPYIGRAVERIAKIGVEAIKKYERVGLVKQHWSATHPLEIHIGGDDELDYGITSPCVDYVSVQRRVEVSSSLGRGVVPHEIFHRIQYQYVSHQDGGSVESAILEGSAVWAEDLIADNYNHYVAASKRFIGFSASNPVDGTPSLIDISHADPYGTSILWKYLAEQHGTTIDTKGFDVALQLLQSIEAYGANMRAIRAMRARVRPQGAFDNCARGDACDATWLDFLIANYFHRSTSVRNPRYTYRENDDDVLWPDANGTKLRGYVIEPYSFAGTRVDGTIRPWSGKYMLYTSSTAHDDLRITLRWTGRTSPLVALAHVRSPGTDEVQILNMQKSLSDVTALTARLEANEALLVVIGSREDPGDYAISIAPVN